MSREDVNLEGCRRRLCDRVVTWAERGDLTGWIKSKFWCSILEFSAALSKDRAGTIQFKEQGKVPRHKTGVLEIDFQLLSQGPATPAVARFPQSLPLCR